MGVPVVDPPPDLVTDHMRQVMQAEDEVILDAALAGAAQTPPCGVRVRRRLGAPIEIAVDPTVRAWEVHEHAA